MACVGGAVVRDLILLDVPQLGQLGDVGVVGPVAEARQIAVGAALAGVLRRGLAVHLQHAAAGLAEHAAHEVEVVDLHRGRGGLVGLVEALQHGATAAARAVPISRGRLRIVAAGTPQTSAARSAVQSATACASSSKPTVWACDVVAGRPSRWR